MVLLGSVQAQVRTPIKGKLLYKNTIVVAANVVNNTAQTTTITDDEGEFEIEVAEGDEIVFSSVQYRIRSVTITPEILQKNRLVVSVNENITELKEVVVTSEDIDKFLDLKEEEFKGFDYEMDKSTRVVNRLTDDRLVNNGIDFVNIAKLIAKVISGKTEEEQLRLKPSEILPKVFDDVFFTQDLQLQQEEVMDFLVFVDSQMKTGALLKQSQQFQLIDYLITKSQEYRNTQKK
ncbi:MAG: carboxypeptidase-like regulatory domain-containing protein [Flavobacteriaceae bacterium]